MCTTIAWGYEYSRARPPQTYMVTISANMKYRFCPMHAPMHRLEVYGRVRSSGRWRYGCPISGMWARTTVSSTTTQDCRARGISSTAGIRGITLVASPRHYEKDWLEPYADRFSMEIPGVLPTPRGKYDLEDTNMQVRIDACIYE